MLNGEAVQVTDALEVTDAVEVLDEWRRGGTFPWGHTTSIGLR
jgi:hypothetical protein